MRTYEIASRTLAPQPTAACYATLSVAEIGEWLGAVLPAVAAHLERNGAGPAGPPYARYHRVGHGRFAVEAGFPASRTVEAEGDVKPSELPGGLAAMAMHVGPFSEMAAAYEGVMRFIADEPGTPQGDPWEIYLSDPADHPDPSSWRTEVVQPYRRG